MIYIRLISCFKDTSQIPEGSDDDHLERPAASLGRMLFNETAIGLSWSMADDDEDLVGLCGYSLHWRESSSVISSTLTVKTLSE